LHHAARFGLTAIDGSTTLHPMIKRDFHPSSPRASDSPMDSCDATASPACNVKKCAIS
jgi:hypothetical protein